MKHPQSSTPLPPAVLYAGLAFGLGLSSSFACKSTVLNPDHCANTLGDETCAEKYPNGTRPYCGIGICFTDVEDGCVEARPDTDDCYSPCGGGMTAEDDLSCAGAEAGSDTGTMTIGDDDDDDDDDDSTTVGDDDDDDDSTTMGDDDDDDTGPMPCMDDDECDQGNQLFCVDEMCVDCTGTPDGDAACAGLDAARPACGGDGSCVECTDTNSTACTDTTPICDTGISECRECLQHSECASGACKIPLGIGTNDNSHGACFETTVTVGAAELFEQIDAVEMGGELAIFVNDVANEGQAVDIPVGTHIAVIAVDADPENDPTWGLLNTGATVTLRGNAGLWLSGVRVRDNSSSEPAIILDGGDLYAQDSWLVQNDGGAVRVDPAGRMVLENVFAGGDVSNEVVLAIVGAQAHLSYTTVVGGFADSRGILCSMDGAVTVDDSIVAAVGTGAAIECVDQTVTTSDVQDADITAWFEDFFAGDLHLAMGHGFSEVAEWNTGDPESDIDGEPRSGVDGTAELPGADLP